MKKFIYFLFGILIMVILIQSPLNAKIKNNPQVWQQHQGDRPIATPLVSLQPQQPINDQLVIYGEVEDKPLIGYLAKPVNQNQNNPAILIIHEWWGLNDNIKAVTRQLAGKGYTALAVDLYQGKLADNPNRARELITIANNKTPILESNIKQAYSYLKNEENAPKIGSLGWCFGGTWSFNTARLFPTELDATVIYYGSGIETDPQILEPLQMPILGIFGELDTNPDPAKVNAFENALNQLGKNAKIYLYPNADHAFANPSGTRYNGEAALDAWHKTLTFFKEYLN
jgi:carboxymethylenebutenolidase